MHDLEAPKLDDHEVRRAFEEELLVAEAADTLDAYLESSGISRAELAARLEVTPGRVSQILAGDANLTLRSVAAAAWALGLRFQLEPTAMERAGTPAEEDPPPPAWLGNLNPKPGTDVSAHV